MTSSKLDVDASDSAGGKDTVSLRTSGTDTVPERTSEEGTVSGIAGAVVSGMEDVTCVSLPEFPASRWKWAFSGAEGGVSQRGSNPWEYEYSTDLARDVTSVNIFSI